MRWLRSSCLCALIAGLTISCGGSTTQEVPGEPTPDTESSAAKSARSGWKKTHDGRRHGWGKAHGRHPSAWTKTHFGTWDSALFCDGERFVRYDARYRKYVGVILCGSKWRYKIYLADAASGPFYQLGDYEGQGEDHCELVNPRFKLQSEADIQSGGCTSCEVNPSSRLLTHSRGYFRSRYGERFEFEPYWHDRGQTASHACGIAIEASTEVDSQPWCPADEDVDSPPTSPGRVTQLESFDSAGGWSWTGNGTTEVVANAMDKVEGAASLAWSSTNNMELTKRFRAPVNLSRAEELRIALKISRDVGDAYTIRLLSGTGFFEQQITPALTPNVWTQNVSQRDSWAPSPFGAPSWAHIHGVQASLYGSDVTTLHFDDLRASTTSSVTPSARAHAGTITDEPAAEGAAWEDLELATQPDCAGARVYLPDTGEQGYFSSRPLHATNFAFAVPANATIRGVRVEIRARKGDVWLAWDKHVQLIVGGARAGADRSRSDDPMRGYAYRYYGGPSDTWDVQLTPAQVNSADFGVSFAIQTHSPPAEAFIDAVRMSIFYTLP